MDSLISSKSPKTWRRTIPWIAAGGIVALILLVIPHQAVARPAPRYMDAVKQEIARLGYHADCRDSEGICTLVTDTPNTPVHTPGPISILLDDSSATVRFVLPDLLPHTKPSGDIALQLLRLNHQLMVAKLSIGDKTGKVVLSAVVNTDSNFDRKTFRSVLQGFIQVAGDVAKKFSSSEDTTQN